MDNAGYATLGRQSGLLREMQAVAHNIANMSTTGYRREGVIFSEFVRATGPDSPSLSMAAGRVAQTDLSRAPMRLTEATFDMAIEGPGFFQVATPDGNALTRAGNFTPLPDGRLVTPAGFALLDAGGAEIQVPPGATAVSVSPDGTLSANGGPVAQIGLWQVPDGARLDRVAGVVFRTPDGVIPAAADTTIQQGFLEGSNVSPVTEISRMIAVQRAYELGQGLLDREDERVRTTLRTLGQ
ncbi:MAG: flagellar hook-basal body complex protein [Pseudomonadota bacterium]